MATLQFKQWQSCFQGVLRWIAEERQRCVERDKFEFGPGRALLQIEVVRNNFGDQQLKSGVRLRTNQSLQV